MDKSKLHEEQEKAIELFLNNQEMLTGARLLGDCDKTFINLGEYVLEEITDNNDEVYNKYKDIIIHLTTSIVNGEGSLENKRLLQKQLDEILELYKSELKSPTVIMKKKAN